MVFLENAALCDIEPDFPVARIKSVLYRSGYIILLVGKLFRNLEYTHHFVALINLKMIKKYT